MVYGFVPLLDDLDNDGDVELVANSQVDIPCENPNGGYLTIKTWDLEAPYNKSSVEWPMFQHDPYNTGLHGFELTENLNCGETPNRGCSGYRYCNNGYFYDKCQVCGCPPNQICRGDGICGSGTESIGVVLDSSYVDSVSYTHLTLPTN